MGRETTMRPEITTDREITTGLIMTRREMMRLDEIPMHPEITMRLRRATATTVKSGHGMGVPRTGRFKTALVSPTRVRLVEDGIRGTAVRPITRYRAASVSRTLDHANQEAASSWAASFSFAIRSAPRSLAAGLLEIQIGKGMPVVVRPESA